MHGNVMEWCEDCWNDIYQGAPADGSAWLSGESARRVVRGGSSDFHPEDLRSAWRAFFNPVVQNPNLGFRVARTLTP
jgi:formylglycine-generating enzyme required for sulfatase activity